MPTQRLHRLPLRQETDGALEALVQGRLELGVVAFHTFAAGAARGWLSSQPLSSSGEGCWICPSVTRGCGEGGEKVTCDLPLEGLGCGLAVYECLEEVICDSVHKTVSYVTFYTYKPPNKVKSQEWAVTRRPTSRSWLTLEVGDPVR